MPFLFAGHAVVDLATLANLHKRESAFLAIFTEVNHFNTSISLLAMSA
jgi:hypothetical protein